jgi:hypothetical protein
MTFNNSGENQFHPSSRLPSHVVELLQLPSAYKEVIENHTPFHRLHLFTQTLEHHRKCKSPDLMSVPEKSRRLLDHIIYITEYRISLSDLLLSHDLDEKESDLLLEDWDEYLHILRRILEVYGSVAPRKIKYYPVSLSELI